VQCAAKSRTESLKTGVSSPLKSFSYVTVCSAYVTKIQPSAPPPAHPLQPLQTCLPCAGPTDLPAVSGPARSSRGQAFERRNTGQSGPGTGERGSESEQVAAAEGGVVRVDGAKAGDAGAAFGVGGQEGLGRQRAEDMAHEALSTRREAEGATVGGGGSAGSAHGDDAPDAGRFSGSRGSHGDLPSLEGPSLQASCYDAQASAKRSLDASGCSSASSSPRWGY
jgi:hypothetical protein